MLLAGEHEIGFLEGLDFASAAIVVQHLDAVTATGFLLANDLGLLPLYGAPMELLRPRTTTVQPSGKVCCCVAAVTTEAKDVTVESSVVVSRDIVCGIPPGDELGVTMRSGLVWNGGVGVIERLQFTETAPPVAIRIKANEAIVGIVSNTQNGPDLTM